MTRPLRVIHCLRSPIGGLFRHVRDLIAGQVDRGIEVGLICDANTGGAAACAALEQLEPLCALGLLRVEMSRLPSLTDIAAYRIIKDHISDLEPEILQGHGAKGGAFARLCSGRNGPKAIYTPHGGSLHYSATSPVGAAFLGLERLLKRRTSGYVFVAEFERDAYRAKVGPVTCPQTIVHNGIADHELLPVALMPDAADFVFIGELRELKGVDLVIKGLAELNKKRPATAVLAGTGALEQDLRILAQTYGIEDQITFAGLQPARTAFAMGRVLILPSRAESFPYAVLEGMGAAKPIITTNVGGIPEMFGDQASSLLPPDDAAAVSAAMEQAITDGAALVSQAETLHARAGQLFSLDRMVQGVCEFYSAILQEKPHLAPSSLGASRAENSA
ncbi:MAG: glycosyltransferase family 4 protein [Alphaproteobacteria bacterium]|nr:glycosyltransferase family 4 protein [Alphaproteobacteria bacterium]